MPFTLRPQAVFQAKLTNSAICSLRFNREKSALASMCIAFVSLHRAKVVITGLAVSCATCCETNTLAHREQSPLSHRVASTSWASDKARWSPLEPRQSPPENAPDALSLHSLDLQAPNATVMLAPPLATPVESDSNLPVPGSQSEPNARPPMPPSAFALTPTGTLPLVPGRRAVVGPFGLVVSVNALATQIGVECLKAGGNAVDAAIAVGFALAVTHPSAGNLGGGGFALVRNSTGETYALDFRESSPAALDKERFVAMIKAGGEGADSVGIPGTVAGLFALSKQFGKLPMAGLIEPARKLAELGHRVERREADAIAVSWPKLKAITFAKKRYGRNDGHPRSLGSVVRLPELATTLAAIQSQGEAGFYDGDVALSIEQALRPNSQVTTEDLKRYRATWRRPLRFPYRSLVVTTMPPPSAGGVALMSGLLQLAQTDPSHIRMNSVERGHLLLEIIRRAQVDRLYSVVDPDTLSGDKNAQKLAQWLTPDRWAKRAPINPYKASRNDEVTKESSAAHESDQTTHFAVVDATGMAVSLTTTLSSGFGSKIITRTGIVLNNSLASFSGIGENRPAPYKRTVSSMAPTLIEDNSGLKLVLGTPGGDTIPSTLLQIINLIVDYGQSLDDAVDAPRIHQSILRRANARYESRRPLPNAWRVELSRMGHHFVTPTSVMGHANSIAIVDGKPYGYVDPREGGLALGLQEPSP